MLTKVVLMKEKQLRKFWENTACETTTCLQGNTASQWHRIIIKVKNIRNKVSYRFCHVIYDVPRTV